MSLHVPTMLVALLLVFVLFGVSLTFAHPFLREKTELRLWAMGTWTLVAGFILLVVRAFIPEWIAVLGGNGLVFTSIYLLSRALHRFVLQHEAPRWQAGLLMVGWACTALLLEQPLHLRTSIFSLLLAAQAAPMVWLIAKRGWHAEVSLRTVAVTFGLAAVALVARATHAMLRPDEYTGFFQASLGNGLTYLASFLLPLGAGFGFVLANLERQALRLNEMATRDALTGCVNRGAFEDALRQTLEAAHRAAEPVSLIIMDLDHFKQVNDVHGHQAGDAVLRDCAIALRGRLRAADTLARLGGEEFAAILPRTDAAGARHAAEDLRSAVEALEIPTSEGVRLRVTLSLGVSTAAPHSQASHERLFAQADKALYAAKHSGRNRSEQFQAA
ncbi:MAG TPA: GGDEF domain-containing protein [Burkholderiaceae bacterium]|nr:GGDEF domain-containing protein [Burkholderiaceae bacterium]